MNKIIGIVTRIIVSAIKIIVRVIKINLSVTVWFNLHPPKIDFNISNPKFGLFMVNTFL